MRTLVTAAALLFLVPFAQAATNLLPNPSFDDAGPDALPTAWGPVLIGNPATFAADPDVKRTGSHSARITAADTARAYFRSPPIPVAPGERVRAGAWVKYENVSPSAGTVILIAEWTGVDGRGHDVAKFDVATRDATASDWQRVEGTLTAPATAAYLRLRLGFSYSQGTCWWDDASVTVETPASLRIDLPTPRVTPALETLPLTLLNRESFKGRATLTVKVGKATATSDVTLTGHPLQTLSAPCPIGKQRNKLPIEATLTLAAAAGKPLATARFDATVPAPLVLPPLSPTHWCIEDGPPTFSGTVDLSASKRDAAAGTLTLRVLDSSGKQHASHSFPHPDPTKPIPFDLAIPSATQGDYKVVAEFRSPTGTHAADQPWHVIPRRLAKVTLNENGYPIHDGKPLFPLGIFNGGRFAEQGAAGFTVSHAYNAVRITPGRDPEDQRAKNFLDQSLAHGAKALFMIPLRHAEEGDWDAVRRRIRLFRNHPALLAWDEEEGLARGDWKPDTLATVHRIIKEEDPHHPFMVGDARDVITKVRGKPDFFPRQHMDLGMWWWYPFPLRDRGGDALAGEEANAGTTLQPPYFLTDRGPTTQPLWVGIQAYRKPGPDQRYPTPAEYRLQAYYALISGAQGLMWYGGGVTGGMHTDPKAAHWDAVQKLATELRSLDWAWLSPTIKQWHDLDGLPVAGLVKRGPRGTLLVAANRSAQRLKLTLPLPAEAEVLNESRRARPGVRETFDPYAVHVYLIQP